MAGFFTLQGRTTKNTCYGGITECALPGQHEAIYDDFSKVVPTGARVLDLASGLGAWAKRLGDRGYDVVACDIRPDLCRVPCTGVDLNEKFAERFGLSSFDAVTAIEMLEHLENPRHILREAARLLKSGGVLTLSTPNASGLHSRLKFFVTGRFAQFDDGHYHSIGHIRPLTYWEIEKILKEAGFEIESIKFFDNFDYIPRTLGEIAKVLATVLLWPLARGVAGGQVIIIRAKKS